MSKPQRSRTARLRASFGRAERLKRETGDGRTAKPAPSREQQRSNRDQEKVRQERTRPERDRKPTPAFARTAARERKLTALENVAKRVERARDTSERQRQQRVKEQTRVAFNREAERRRDTTRRAEQERQRQFVEAARKRADDTRRRQAQKATDRKREDVRRAFNREAERRRDAARRVEHERTRQRAGLEIEQRHKRQRADQQAEHRRQTAEVRLRHQAETRSLRSNESLAMERHHHAVKGIDDREARTLADFDGRRSGLAGRLAELVPGRRAENDRQRGEIQKGFEAERMTKHRDLEALKERQFKLAQETRINQAKERKASMEGHRAERTRLAERQTADRPRQIEGQARVLERVDRERGREQEHVRKESARDMPRPTPAFAKA